MKTSARLRVLRKNRKPTQEQLAKLAALLPDTIRRMEQGLFSPSFDTLVKIACGLRVPVPALLCDEYDRADDLATMARHLPEREQMLAFNVLGTLYRTRRSRSSRPSGTRRMTEHETTDQCNTMPPHGFDVMRADELDPEHGRDDRWLYVGRVGRRT
jgi:transcriptional regulator with XRE-family HTH domain